MKRAIENGHLMVLVLGTMLFGSLAQAQEISVVSLGRLGGAESKALDVNKRGQIVGEGLAASNDTQAFLIDPRDTDGDGDPDRWFEDVNADGTNDLMINLTPGAHYCRATKINDLGQVLGEGHTVDDTRFTFIIIPEDSNGDGIADLWFRDDGDGGNELLRNFEGIGWVTSQNNHGLVVGTLYAAEGPSHNFIWSASEGLTDIGPMSLEAGAYAVDINDHGQIIGIVSFWTGGATTKALMISPLDTDDDGTPDLWFQDLDLDGANDLVIELVGLGGMSQAAYDINEKGQAAGTGWTPTNVGFPIYWSSPSQPLDLGGFGGDSCDAIALNEHGQVIGHGYDPEDNYIPFFWSEGTGFVNLGSAGGYGTCAWAINNKGQVICSEELFNFPWGPLQMAMRKKPFHAFLWSPETGRVDIPGLDGVDDLCFPVALNDHGLIVGASGSIDSSETAVLWNIENTGAGTNVAVTPVDPVTGEAPVTLTFADVVEGGDTTLTVVPTGAPPPSGLKLGNPPVYYVIETTAVYSGPITICINYAGVSYGNEINLRLFHDADGYWVDITTSLDTDNDVICGEVPSLSTFALFELDVEAVGFEPPLAALVPLSEEAPLPDVAFKQGRTLPLKLDLFSGDRLLTDADVVAPPKIVAIMRDGEAVPMETLDLDSGEANDSGVFFRFPEAIWIFNLSTKGLITGTYAITLELPDGDHVWARFSLR
jgi:uncharacterized membrane protein